MGYLLSSYIQKWYTSLLWVCQKSFIMFCQHGDNNSLYWPYFWVQCFDFNSWSLNGETQPRHFSSEFQYGYKTDTFLYLVSISRKDLHIFGQSASSCPYKWLLVTPSCPVTHSSPFNLCLNDQAYNCLSHFYKKDYYADLWWKTTFNGRHPLMEDALQRKMTFMENGEFAPKFSWKEQ